MYDQIMKELTKAILDKKIMFEKNNKENEVIYTTTNPINITITHKQNELTVRTDDEYFTEIIQQATYQGNLIAALQHTTKSTNTLEILKKINANEFP